MDCVVVAAKTIPGNFSGVNSQKCRSSDCTTVKVDAPSNVDKVNSFLSLRVADIRACHREWGRKGACFPTQPLDNHGWELRCYMRDPDGYLIEVGQYSQMALDSFESGSI